MDSFGRTDAQLLGIGVPSGADNIEQIWTDFGKPGVGNHCEQRILT
jgi:hypothetical protein